MKRIPSRLVRSFRLFVLAVVAVLAGAGVVACGGSDSSDANTINMLTWEDYHNADALKKFTEETGIKVNAINVGSPDEMFSKVKANPGQFDLILATSGWFDAYASSDLLETIDMSKLDTVPEPGFDWKAVASSNGKLYGVVYNWGDNPLAWTPGSIPNTPEMAKYLDDKGRPNDWNILWDPAFKGRVSVMDDPTSSLPMVPLSLGITNPYDLTDQQFTEVQAKLEALRPQIKRLTSGFNDQTTQFATGEATIGVLNIISEVPALRKQGKDLEVNHLVKQGVGAWSDNYSITKQGGTKKLDAVYKFINYTNQVPWQAQFIANTLNSGNLSLKQAQSPEAAAAGLTPELLEGTLIPATADGDAFFSKMRFFQTVEDLTKRVDMWNQFKLGLSS